MTDASIARRGSAVFLDFIFILAFAVIFGSMLPTWQSYSLPVIGISSTYLVPLIAPFYFILLEGHKGGTPGKAALSIRVVNLKQKEISYKQSLIRNILRPIDVLPAFWLVGVVSIFLTEENQRVGDLAADTKVVNQ